MNQNEKDRLLEFLLEVDKDFPVALSNKVNINDYSKKLYEKADVIYKEEGNEIVGCVAGYCRNSFENIAYISLVATKKSYRNQGISTELINKFIDMAKSQNKNAIHLYASAEDYRVVLRYKRLGFVDYNPLYEERPEDVHLIYYIE